MVEILDTINSKVSQNSGTTRITIKKGWDSLLNMEPGEEIELGIASGKHGLHLVAYSKENQPKIGEIEETI